MINLSSAYSNNPGDSMNMTDSMAGGNMTGMNMTSSTGDGLMDFLNSCNKILDKTTCNYILPNK
jgi:hypothetical protein